MCVDILGSLLECWGISLSLRRIYFTVVAPIMTTFPAHISTRNHHWSIAAVAACPDLGTVRTKVAVVSRVEWEVFETRVVRRWGCNVLGERDIRRIQRSVRMIYREFFLLRMVLEAGGKDVGCFEVACHHRLQSGRSKSSWSHDRIDLYRECVFKTFCNWI